jgi:signal transduction histidine kinase/ActR/RegA family two-component response regulator
MGAVLLGPGPASIVVLIGFVSGLLMLDPIGSFHVADRTDCIALALYLVLSIAFLLVGGRVRRFALAAAEARAEMAMASVRAERTAQLQEKRFLVAIEASSVPFCLLDPVRDENGLIVDYRYAYLNKAGASNLGRTKEALMGRNINEVLLGSWEPGVLECLRSVSDTGEPVDFEHYSSANGVIGWYHTYVSALEDSVVVWFHDISAQKRTELSLQEEAKSKDRFIATLAHELRNPLAPIQQATSLMRMTGANEQTRDWAAEVIDRQARHMSLLLNDLLDMSRISRGVLTLRKAMIELKPAIYDAVEAANPLIRSRDHELTVRMPPGEIYLEADEVRVTQIVSNLLTNAAKYTEKGGKILLVVEREPEFVSICVHDNGIGIKKEKLQEVFEMFTQVRPEKEMQDGGLGIGLAVTKGLVELHGGTIEALSGGPGTGSRFIVRLPAQHYEIAKPADQPAPEQGEDGALRILIADDNQDAADVLASLMELEGHQVRVAYEGKTALNCFYAFQPHIAFLDIGMPLMTGIQIAQTVRASDEGRGVMLVAVTGWGQDTDRADTLRAGFDHHLTKPVSFDKLKEILRDVGEQLKAEPAEP